jgi:hypothetical protein|tara:strand:+ start:702 stop:932 length:231 start_codon:yes stop_codon:yes gene_type:complete
MSKIIQLSIPQEPEIDSGNLLIEDYIEEKSESDTPMDLSPYKTRKDYEHYLFFTVQGYSMDSVNHDYYPRNENHYQ